MVIRERKGNNMALETFTKLRDSRFPKMGTESISMEDRGGVWVYPHIPDPYSPVGARVVPTSVLEDFVVPYGPEHEEAEKVANTGFLGAYAEAQSDERTAEERFELEAAFGKGAKVVDFFTGRVTVV
jgi:hypothetical protein